MRVNDLGPGDQVEMGFITGTFIVKAPHPIYDSLMLVIWWVRDKDGAGRYSFDALSPNQDVGMVIQQEPRDREANLWAAIRGEL